MAHGFPEGGRMRAMVLREQGKPLVLEERPIPEPGPGQVLLKVHACGICRTDLHVVDGELTEPKLPLVPGHEIVGTVVALGPGVEGMSVGDRIGVPWLGWTCGSCRYCLRGQENLCPHARFTGYTLDGGFAEYTVADARYCFPLPAGYDAVHAAPLLCAGLIGYRAYAKTGDARRLGFYGFGAAAHLMAQVARHQGKEVYAFTRPGDRAGQDFALRLGAVWAGASGEAPPVPLDAAVLFAPVGELLPEALRRVDKGGRVVCAGIYMTDIPSFPYADLWWEREVVSVTNLTRQDGVDFLRIASEVHLHTEVHPYPLEEANRALDDFRSGRFEGAAVLVP